MLDCKFNDVCLEMEVLKEYRERMIKIVGRLGAEVEVYIKCIVECLVFV